MTVVALHLDPVPAEIYLLPDRSLSDDLEYGLCAPETGTLAHPLAEDWFPFPSQETPEYARRQCAGCPVTLQCLELALRRDGGGIWGATTTDERSAIRRARAEVAKEAAQAEPAATDTEDVA